MQFLGATILVFFVTWVHSSPVPHHKYSKNDHEKVYYDQKQEGELNVRADLKNFVILVIPTAKQQASAEEPSNLLDFLMKAQQHNQNKRHPSTAPVKHDTHEIGRETMTFLEAKTAPYHVDISKSDSHLMNDEIKATQSPPATLPKSKREKDGNSSKNRAKRFTEALILTVPEEDFVLSKTDDVQNELITNEQSNDAENGKGEMTLLGALEQCGPEMYRDEGGLCKLRNSV
ncbi:uncharacterized protein LOC132703686 [Cylas formicarius]|uniref:uncharacterized protein LOC132703686 n=1 Tax=Cylas formicarius TaxID=197179 RepID=UPI002958BB6E|nr:uncharacterized protein LOC132703686 [Cylas formicarius]